MAGYIDNNKAFNEACGQNGQNILLSSRENAAPVLVSNYRRKRPPTYREFRVDSHLSKLTSSLLSRSTNKNTPSPERRGSKTEYETIAVSLFTKTNAHGICDLQISTYACVSTILYQKRDCSHFVNFAQTEIAGSSFSGLPLRLLTGAEICTTIRFNVGVETSAICAIKKTTMTTKLANDVCC